MLTVTNSEHMKKVTDALSKEARASLSERLLYLAGYGGGTFDVTLTPNHDGFNVLWVYAKSGAEWMFGGLVHHKNDDSWGIHT